MQGCPWGQTLGRQGWGIPRGCPQGRFAVQHRLDTIVVAGDFNMCANTALDTDRASENPEKGPTIPVCLGKRGLRRAQTRQEAEASPGGGGSGEGMRVWQEIRQDVPAVVEWRNGGGIQPDPANGQGINVPALQGGENGTARAGVLPPEGVQAKEDQRGGADGGSSKAEGSVEAVGTCGNGDAKGVGQGAQKDAGAGRRQLPEAEPAWLSEMRRRYNRHDAMTPDWQKGSLAVETH